MGVCIFYLSSRRKVLENFNTEQSCGLRMDQNDSKFCSQGKSVTIKQLLSNFGHLDKGEKLPREIVNPNVQKDILWMEKQEGSMNFKFGIIYAKAGQIMDDELFSNETGSSNFTNFLNLLGENVQ